MSLTPRLLAGPPPAAGMEPLSAHVGRLGPAPRGDARLLEVLAESGLRGRGGASFPVGDKWRTVAGRRRGRAVVLANGAEGEPLSHKDRMLMACRPHLVLDGAFLAAGAVHADSIVLYVGEEHRHARAALEHALSERGDAPCSVHLVQAPNRYVAGEESAAVHLVNDGLALPTDTPPRPFERGVDGRPTLVQNVETLAHAALVARYGARWFREGGRDGSPGTVLLTVNDGRGHSVVVEVPQGTPVGEALALAGAPTAGAGAVLVGGYFGAWARLDEALGLPLDAVALRRSGLSLGCGVVALAGAGECGVDLTARIAAYLAGESAGQCGPCVFGLRAIAEALARLAACRPQPHDVARVRSWAGGVRGRGACKHPDGAAAMVLSALDVFDDEVTEHVHGRRCTAQRTAVPA